MNFRCRVCKESVHMKKEVGRHFSGWAYDCAEWSDFDENVPALSEKHWVRSEKTPVVGETRSAFVTDPFDEETGNEFFLLYEPALLHFNGWDDNPDDIDKCAIVRCRFEKVLLSDEYSAWISVKVTEVIFMHELYRAFTEVRTHQPIDAFEGIRGHELYFQNDRWLITGWSGQDDAGETRWIYTDDSGEKHLVMTLNYTFHKSVLNIGNIVNSDRISDII